MIHLKIRKMRIFNRRAQPACVTREIQHTAAFAAPGRRIPPPGLKRIFDFSKCVDYNGSPPFGTPFLPILPRRNHCLRACRTCMGRHTVYIMPPIRLASWIL